jgi:hypothetical protein
MHLYETLNLPQFTHLPTPGKTINIGDDIQTICASNIWKFDDYIERDNFKLWKSDDVIPFFGWYGHGDFTEPPKASTFLISFHLSENLKRNISKNVKIIDWLRSSIKNQGFPAFARDSSTVQFMRSFNLDCEFGGCITQTLNPYNGVRSGVYNIDAPYVENCDQYLSNMFMYLPTYDTISRLKIARLRLKLLKTSELIHTNKLHVALPCHAMGTPFKFYNFNIFDPIRLTGYEKILGIE